MTRYRLHYINPNTGQVDRQRAIDASDDVDAVHNARACDHRPLELWCEGRKVRSFDKDERLPA